MTFFSDNTALAFGYIGNFMSFIVYVAPIFTFRKIYEDKSTVGHTFMPYIVAFLSSALWLYYGVLGSTKPIMYINIFGCIIEMVYISTYIYYAEKEVWTKILKLLCLGIVTVSVTIIVTCLAFRDIIFRIKIVGWAGTIFSLVVFAAPVQVVMEVFKTRSNEFIPIELLCCSALSGLVWLGYGLAKREVVMIISNGVGFVVCLLQMLVWWAFRQPQPQTD